MPRPWTTTLCHLSLVGKCQFTTAPPVHPLQMDSRATATSRLSQARQAKWEKKEGFQDYTCTEADGSVKISHKDLGRR